MTERNAVEVLAEEFLSRHRRGEEPSIAGYVERHPDLADEIEELFPAMLLMERLKPRDTTGTLAPKPPAEPAEPLERLGDFRVIREIGRGGMGIVYEAIQESLGRRVALKVLPPGSLASPRRLERFRREAMATAGLHHQNIVQVFGVGEQDGMPYYVMQLISGRGLDEILADPDARPSAREAAALALQAARALEHAHAKGIIHRDVKPENIRVDESGTVWLTDFGLAKILAAEALTETGDLLGTIRYMAPERFAGRSDARGDIYGLGLTLYELLVGRQAFEKRDRGSVIDAIRREGPERPCRVVPSIPNDLETIVLEAIALDPEDRYASVGDLAEDLERFLEDRPIRARRAGAVERAWRWCRRNRALAALGATAAGSLVLAAVFGWVGTLMTTNALERESQRRGEAEAATRRAVENEQLSLDALEEIFDSLAGADRFGPPRERGPGEMPGTELLQSVLSFYDRFAEKNATDPRLRLEAARARRRVGVIQSSRGFSEEAAEAFAMAAEQLGALCREFPENPDHRLELAVTLADMMDGSEGAVDLTRAEEHARRALEHFSERDGSGAAARPSFDGMRAREALARILAGGGRHEEALALLDEMLRDQRGRPGRPPASRIQGLRATSLRSLGREAEAREADRQAAAARRGPRSGSGRRPWPRGR